MIDQKTDISDRVIDQKTDSDQVIDQKTDSDRPKDRHYGYQGYQGYIPPFSPFSFPHHPLNPPFCRQAYIKPEQSFCSEISEIIFPDIAPTTATDYN